jgi:iron complex outermembrane receptor protein
MKGSNRIAVQAALWGSCALGALAGAMPALAQDAAAPEATSGMGGGDEIIVTARRREENVQDVPAAIQVLGGDALEQRNIRTEQDLATAVPGLLVRSNNNQFQVNYVMRGESFEPYSGSVPGVQPYVNEVALSGNAAPPFYDLENVQVLKGPQGTLFGRNSTGGAVLYQTKRPGSEFGGFASIQYGRFDRVVAEGAVNVPIMPDVIELRLAGTYQAGGAYVRNLYDDKLLGDSKVKSGRATLTISPSAAFTSTTMLQLSEYDADNIPKRLSYVAPCGTGSAHPCWAMPGNAFYDNFVSSPQGTYFPGWPAGALPPGGLTGMIAYLDANGRYTVSANGTGDNHATETTVINNSTLELSDALTLKNIFGYSKTNRRGQTDNDNTPYPFLQTGGTVPGNPLEGRATRQISNEFQIQGTAFDKRLNYIVGAFYSHNITNYDSPTTGASYTPSIDFYTVFNVRYQSKTRDEAYAVFGQGTYAVTDRLNVTAGIRQAWDKLWIQQSPGSTLGGVTGSVPQHTTVNDLSWTFSIDYKASPSLLVYATTRGSWRVGGYNPFVPTGVGNRTTAADGGNYFPPETVRDVELGFKLDDRVGGMPVRFNADFFYAWMKNIEKTGTTVINNRVTSTTLSVPAGKIWGVEADASIRPTSWLTIGGNITYNKGRFTDREALIFGVPVVYNTFPDTPVLSGALYADATASLGEAGELRFHADMFGQTSFHLTSLGDTFNPGDKVPGYALVNLRADWVNPLGTEGITASAFVKNVTGEYYFTGGGGGVQANGTNSLNLGMPRTWGVQLRADF